MHPSMLKRILSVLAICLPAVACGGSTASLTLTVTLQPDSCDVALSNASVQAGNIPASALSEKVNLIKPDSTVLSVTCNAATAMAIRTTDNRTSSAWTLSSFSEETGGGTLPTTDDNTLYGLGTDSNNRKTGALLLGISAVTHDAQTGALVYSTDKSTWTSRAISASDAWIIPRNSYFSVATGNDDATPISLTQATFAIQPFIYLKNAAQYRGGEQVNIDGNVTFSIVYL